MMRPSLTATARAEGVCASMVTMGPPNQMASAMAVLSAGGNWLAQPVSSASAAAGSRRERIMATPCGQADSPA